MEHRFQPILSVALNHDRGAGVEVDIQILRLTRTYGEAA
jgi:hypothetical protein